jgi:hypothetical protein
MNKKRLENLRKALEKVHNTWEKCPDECNFTDCAYGLKDGVCKRLYYKYELDENLNSWAV